MKKILLPGMLAALAFAACTNEEIVSQQTEAPEADLSDRPVVGMVDLNFGPQTRASLAVNGNYATLNWEKDAVGARLIDDFKGSRNQHNPVVSYEGSDYAHTNYKYNKVEGELKWTTEALLVEGNYMFYAPYDENARNREPLKFDFPLAQTVNTEDEGVKGVDANTSAIDQFYGNEYEDADKKNYVFAIGHAFINADESDPVVAPTMTHLYAYPQITLKNNYSIDVENEPVGQSITIDKIIVSSENIFGKYQMKHDEFITNLTRGYDAVWNGRNKLAEAVEEGTWHKGLVNGIRDFQNAKTVDLMEGSNAGDIVVDFNPDLKLGAGDEYPFHLVLPAAVYGDLKIKVILEGSKTFYCGALADGTADYNSDIKEFVSAANVADANGAEVTGKLTYAPMHRYPVEEWNFPVGGDASAKQSAGALATYTLDGTIGNYTAPVLGIKELSELEDVLMAIKNNTNKTITEGAATFTLYTYKDEDVNGKEVTEDMVGYAQLRLNKDLTDLIEKYLVDGQVAFTSPMIIEESFTSNKYVSAVGGLMQIGDDEITLGNITIASNSNSDVVFNGKVTLNGTEINDNVTFGGKVVLNNANITGNVVFKDEILKVNNWTESTATISGNAELMGGILNGSVGSATFVGGTTTMKANVTGSRATTVVGGTVNVQADLKSIVVYNDATLNLNKTNYTGTITVGVVDSKDKYEDAGNLNINAYQRAAEIALESGIVTNNKEITLASWSWTAGTLKNNATINTTLDVPAGATYEHGANAVANISKVKSETVDDVVVNGIVKNYGELVVGENNGLIETMGNMTYTTVKAGTGAINNTNLGVVYAADHVVYYNTGSFSNGEAWEKIKASTQNSINKLVVTGEWNVTAATPVPATYTVVEFQSNLNVTDVTLTFAKTTEVVLGTDSKWQGRTIGSSIVKGMKCVKENGKVWTVKYLTLDYASNAMDNGGVLKLTGDLTFKNAHNLTGLDLVIDLNGFTLTSSADKAIVLGNNSTLTIKNGTFKSEKDQLIRIEGKATLNVEADAVLEAKSTTIFATKNAKDATLNIKGTVKATDANVCAVVTNGTIKNITVNIDGATIESNGGEGSVALYVPSSGNVTIKDSNLKGYDSAVEYRGEGKLTINGGTFESTAPTFSATANGSGSTIVGAAVAVSPYADRDVEVVISGTPTLKAGNANCCAFWEGTTVETKGRTTVNDFRYSSESVGEILKGQDTTKDNTITIN